VLYFYRFIGWFEMNFLRCDGYASAIRVQRTDPRPQIVILSEESLMQLAGFFGEVCVSE
jgi:hypothetical protein